MATTSSSEWGTFLWETWQCNLIQGLKTLVCVCVFLSFWLFATVNQCRSCSETVVGEAEQSTWCLAMASLIGSKTMRNVVTHSPIDFIASHVLIQRGVCVWHYHTSLIQQYRSVWMLIGFCLNFKQKFSTFSHHVQTRLGWASHSSSTSGPETERGSKLVAIWPIVKSLLFFSLPWLYFYGTTSNVDGHGGQSQAKKTFDSLSLTIPLPLSSCQEKK